MFKLRLQFFLVLLLMSSLLTSGLYVFIKYSFQHDFWHYINKKEMRFFQPLANDLIKNYNQHKNWLWITEWDQYLFQNMEISDSSQPSQRNNFPLPHPNDFSETKNESDRKPLKKETVTPGIAAEPRDKRGLNRRGFINGNNIFLLDNKHQLIAGKNNNRKEPFLLPLKSEQKIIGYLGIPVNPALRDLQDADFAHLQENKLALIIGITLIIAGLIAFPLAHFLSKRINILVAQVRHLSQGHYQERITITGKDEISILAEHLNHLSETLAQSEQTRRQWVADISHELRTPMAVLQAELEAMEDGVRALDTHSVIRLQKHCQRLKHLVNDLYELSLTDIGGMTYRKNTLNLSVLVQESVNTMQPQFTKASLNLSITVIESPSVYIFGDQDRLQQLMANLLKNSLQYTNSPGVTQVSLTTDNDIAIINIEDSSPGVDPSHHPKLFDRLYRADSSRTRATGGAGLGLSICKNIVSAHDGDITISNSELGGLKTTIRLPYQQK